MRGKGLPRWPRQALRPEFGISFFDVADGEGFAVAHVLRDSVEHRSHLARLISGDAGVAIGKDQGNFDFVHLVLLGSFQWLYIELVIQLRQRPFVGQSSPRRRLATRWRGYCAKFGPSCDFFAINSR